MSAGTSIGAVSAMHHTIAPTSTTLRLRRRMSAVELRAELQAASELYAASTVAWCLLCGTLRARDAIPFQHALTLHAALDESNAQVGACGAGCVLRVCRWHTRSTHLRCASMCVGSPLSAARRYTTAIASRSPAQMLPIAVPTIDSCMLHGVL